MWVRLFLLICTSIAASQAAGEVLVAARTIRSQTIISPEDLAFKDAEISGAATVAQDVIGLETQVAIYAGRPIFLSDLGPPTLVERNQIVTLIYTFGGLQISTEGRALGRASAGDQLRVMNLSSRTTINATVDANGKAVVNP